MNIENLKNFKYPKIYQSLKQNIFEQKTKQTNLFISKGEISFFLAKKLANLTLCLDRKNCKATNKCRICNMQNNNPDLLILNQEEKLDMKTIEVLQYFISQKPSVSQNKIVIIDNIETLNEHVNNALLKSFEEANSFIYFYLLSKNENQIMATILSRAQMYKFEYKKEHLFLLKDELNLDKFDDFDLFYLNNCPFLLAKVEDNKCLKNLLLEKKNIKLWFFGKKNLASFFGNIFSVKQTKENYKEIIKFIKTLFFFYIDISLKKHRLIAKKLNFLPDFSKEQNLQLQVKNIIFSLEQILQG